MSSYTALHSVYYKTSFIQILSQVTFEGIVGSSFKGDIAIDDVSIKRGRCLTSPGA